MPGRTFPSTKEPALSWNNSICLDIGRKRFGALVWGSLEARNQWAKPINLDRPNVQRQPDGRIVAAVKKGALSATMLQAFAIEYRVFHYPLAPKNGREERLTDIALALDAIYRDIPEADAETLALLWWQAIEKVRDVCIAHGMQSRLLALSA